MEANMSADSLRVLVVDDERPIRQFLRTSLSAHGHQVFEATNGTDALNMMIVDRHDLVILDLGLPDIDGIKVVKQLRDWTQTPIIILSVREHESDKIAALDAGADDYLTKPFSVGELMARMRVALRHTSQSVDSPIFQSGDLVVDLAHRLVTVGGQEIQLTPIEYDLLKTMISQVGKVLTQRQLLRQVWGDAYEDEAHLLRVHISNLRNKIESEPARPQLIITEPGVGYRFHLQNSQCVYPRVLCRRLSWYCGSIPLPFMI
jgi:two-component system, OmpR family, KDP operon response regulator KdpE